MVRMMNVKCYHGDDYLGAAEASEAFRIARKPSNAGLAAHLFPICSQLRSGDTNLPAWVCCFAFSLSFFSFFLLQTKTGTSVGRWRSLFPDEAALTQIAVASVDPRRVKEAPYSSPSLFVVFEQTVKSPDEPRPEARRPRRQHAPTGP